jgi:PmbA protein
MPETTASSIAPDILPDLVAAALKAGADAAEAVSSERASLSVGVRNGLLEDVEREESRDLGLRVFVGRRQATVSASDLSDATRHRLVERAVAMARLAPEDPYASLAQHDRLAKGPFPDLDLIDPYEPTAEALETQARLAEDHARAVKGVTNTDGGSASWSSTRWSLVTTAGFHGTHAATGHSVSA